MDIRGVNRNNMQPVQSTGVWEKISGWFSKIKSAIVDFFSKFSKIQSNVASTPLQQQSASVSDVNNFSNRQVDQKVQEIVNKFRNSNIFSPETIPNLVADATNLAATAAQGGKDPEKVYGNNFLELKNTFESALSDYGFDTDQNEKREIFGKVLKQFGIEDGKIETLKSLYYRQDS